MKKIFLGTFALLLLVGSFLAGSWYNHSRVTHGGAVPIRKILYYIDPMHPSYKSDKPGTAPDCGMELVSVYDDGTMGSSGPSGSALPPGTVNVSPEKQVLFGVRVARVEKVAVTQSLRVVGRVATDETRIYRINSAVDGWIRDIYPNSVGSLTKKDEKLASYYAPEFLSAQQAYLFALGAMDRFQSTGKETPEQFALTRMNIQQYKDSLRNLGMGDLQIEEIAKTRQYTENVHVYAPVTGFILARNVSQGQRFDKGTELYRLADLSHVWILADVFGNEAQHLRPGVSARVSLPDQGRTFEAKVSNVLPQFDGTTRTLKVRLEADNPGYVLRPDMFVDLEVTVARPEAITVPVDAVVDSGIKKTVYVAKGDGIFEPRKVETGWRHGDRVEIVKGLMPGERIVVSGAFLLDSESRMKAAAGIYGESSECPICGMEVDQAKAKAAGLTSQFRGQTYYFCSDEDKAKFDKEPTRYAMGAAEMKEVLRPKHLRGVQWKGAPVLAPETWGDKRREMGRTSGDPSRGDLPHD